MPGFLRQVPKLTPPTIGLFSILSEKIDIRRYPKWFLHKYQLNRIDGSGVEVVLMHGHGGHAFRIMTILDVAGTSTTIYM